MNNGEKPMIDPENVDFGTICICAVRYALDRNTYMPGLVQEFIRSYLPYIESVVLSIIEKDIESAEDLMSGYRFPNIERPGWRKFRSEIREEIERRK